MTVFESKIKDTFKIIELRTL